MSQGRSEHTEGAHATEKQYVQIAVILAVITLLEVGIYYIESLKGILVPSLLVMSAAKFALVAMFFMHLKFDHKLFSVLFTAPLVLTGAVLIVLMTLLGALFR